jgi:hypothetical protein
LTSDSILVDYWEYCPSQAAYKITEALFKHNRLTKVWV